MSLLQTKEALESSCLQAMAFLSPNFFFLPCPLKL